MDRNVGVEHPASTSQWSPPPRITATARTALETAVARVPTAWLIPPQDGELFDRPDKAFGRLQGYALGAGFAVVKGPTTPIRKIYQCIHHGGAIRNNRKLSDQVERDPDNPKVIISSRKRDNTQANALSCKWRWYITLQTTIDAERNKVNQWILREGRTREGHSHPLAKTALIYHIHKMAQSEYARAVVAATAN